MSRLAQLWRNRHVLPRILDMIEQAVALGMVPAEIRKRLADGVQRHDIVSDDALDKVIRAHDRATMFIRGK